MSCISSNELSKNANLIGDSLRRGPSVSLGMNYNRSLMVTARAMMPLLILQFLLGMFATLFVNFPSSSGSSNPLIQIFASGSLIVAAHVIIAVLLLVLSILLLTFSAFTRRRVTVALSATGLIFMGVAFYAGIAFAFSGYSNNALSYLMAVGFIISFVVYGAIAGASGRPNYAASQAKSPLGNSKPIDNA